MGSDEWISKMPCSHLSSCIHILTQRCKWRGRRGHWWNAFILWAACMCPCMFSGCLPVLRCADEPPKFQKNTKGEETKQTPKSVCHLCLHTAHTCHEYSGTVAGPGKCWSGAWPILLGQTPTLPCLILLPLSCASLWTHSEATRLHNSSQNLHFLNAGMKNKRSPTLEMGLRGKNN